GQRQVSTIFTQLSQYRVILEIPPREQQDPDELGRIFVRGAAGAVVPLGALVRFRTQPAPLLVRHQGEMPSVAISFDLAPDVSLDRAIAAITRRTEALWMPPSVATSFQGPAEEFRSALVGEGALVLAALLTVFIVLGMLYESFVHPITILSTLPSA